LPGRCLAPHLLDELTRNIEHFRYRKAPLLDGRRFQDGWSPSTAMPATGWARGPSSANNVSIFF